jgi:predicted 3-demethylubiquinone-9 3-methyltransferase (glyoxalase superfamily)
MLTKITPCLWFDTQAEEAANFYVSIFPDSKITAIARFPESGHEVHGQRAGSVMTVAFDLGAHSFIGLNGGPYFKFTEAISLTIECARQEEVDYYWGKLSEGGDPESQQCGWVKDRFGLSWQIVPNLLPEIYVHGEPEVRERVFSAMLQMRKLDIPTLERAARG